MPDKLKGTAFGQVGRRAAPSGLLRRAPWGLVGMLLLVLMAESSFKRHPEGLIDRFEWMARVAFERASRGAVSARILCLGDSQLMAGVWPRAVESRCGRSVLNLAVAASPAGATEILLRRALERGAKPEALVIDFAPLLLNFTPRQNLPHYRALVPSLRNAAKLAWSARDPALLGELLLSSVLPSLRSRLGARETLQAALNGGLRLTLLQNVSYLRQTAQNSGAVLNPTLPVPTSPEALDAWLRVNYPGIASTRANGEAIGQVLRLAGTSGARVFWLLPPIFPAAQDRVEASGRDAQHLAFVRAWQARFPGITVVDARRALVDPRAFADQHHLSGEGAHALSLALGDLLRKELGRPVGDPPSSWLPVAGLRPMPLPADAEDMSASEVMVSRTGNRLAY